MSYLGRVEIALLNTEGNVLSAYAISGRSPPSKKRRFELFPEEGRVYVGPIGEMTDDQIKMKDLIFYNCMRTKGHHLIVTNGAQTDVSSTDKPNFYDALDARPNIRTISHIMQKWGYEADKPIFTPRTALVLSSSGEAIFSIAARESDDDERTTTSTLGTGLTKPGSAWSLATYKGHDTQALPWRGFDINRDGKYLSSQHFLSNTPEELTEEMYAFMDPRYVVAAVAALWDGDKWIIAEPKNRFKDEEEFQSYAAANR